MQVVMLPCPHTRLHSSGMRQVLMGKATFLKCSFPEPVAKGGMFMEIAVAIAAASLVVDIIRTVFDIAWPIYMERKHNKKEK